MTDRKKPETIEEMSLDGVAGGWIECHEFNVAVADQPLDGSAAPGDARIQTGDVDRGKVKINPGR